MEAGEECVRGSCPKDKEMDAQGSSEVQVCKAFENLDGEDNSLLVVSSHNTPDIEALESKLQDEQVDSHNWHETKAAVEDMQECKQNADLLTRNNLSSNNSTFSLIELGTLKSNEKQFDSDNFLGEKEMGKDIQEYEQTTKGYSPLNDSCFSTADVETLESKLQDVQVDSYNSHETKAIAKGVQECKQNSDLLTKNNLPFSPIELGTLENNDKQIDSGNFLGGKEIEKDDQEYGQTTKGDSTSNDNSFSTVDAEILDNKLQDKQCNSNNSPGKNKIVQVQECEQILPGNSLSNVSPSSTVGLGILQNDLQYKRIDSESKSSANNIEHMEMSKPNSSDILNNALALLKQYNSDDSESETTKCSDCEIPVKSTLLKDKLIANDTPLVNSNMYREESNSDTDQNDSDVEFISDQKEADFYNKDDAEDDDDEGLMADCENMITRKPKPPRVHGELLLEDLPPIQDLHITVPEKECIQFGQVHSIVQQLVLVSTLPTSPLLNLDTVLFLDKGQRVLGEIFDVCGPVSEPLYCIRFNSNDQIKDKNITVGDIVYVAPKTEHTQYVILSSLMKMRGSDASWEHDIEPPPRYLDYSDDEEERRARQKLHKNKRIAQQNDKSDSSDDNNKNITKEAPSAKKGLRNQRNKRNQHNRGNQHTGQSVTDNNNCGPSMRPRWRQSSSTIRHNYQNSWHSNYSQRHPSSFSSNYMLPGQGLFPQFYGSAVPPPLPAAPSVSQAVRSSPLSPSYSQIQDRQIFHQPPPPPSNFVRNPFSRSPTS